MDARTFAVFVKVAAEKIGFNRERFKEGLWDEGVPLAGATIGAGLGGLRGAALGYAAGGGASLARSYMRGEKPSMSRKLLAAGALGYGAGGGLHAGIEHMTSGAKPGSFRQKWFHPGAGTSTWRSRLAEEALPAAGATVATGLAKGYHKPRPGDEDA